MLNDEKKEVGKEIIFPGRKITENGIMSDEKKVEAVLNVPAPTNIKSQFVPDLSNTLEPIRKLTRKDVPFEWNEQCEHAFNKVKEQMTKAPVLVYFNPNSELVVQADSSQSGLSAVLLQNGKTIEFASRSLLGSERKWA